MILGLEMIFSNINSNQQIFIFQKIYYKCGSVFLEITDFVGDITSNLILGFSLRYLATKRLVIGYLCARICDLLK